MTINSNKPKKLPKLNHSCIVRIFKKVQGTDGSTKTLKQSVKEKEEGKLFCFS